MVPFVLKMKPTLEKLNVTESGLRKYAEMATVLKTKDHTGEPYLLLCIRDYQHTIVTYYPANLADLQRTVDEIKSTMSDLTKLDGKRVTFGGFLCFLFCVSIR